jgi:hypothetical protein
MKESNTHINNRQRPLPDPMIRVEPGMTKEQAIADYEKKYGVKLAPNRYSLFIVETNQLLEFI